MLFFIGVETSKWFFALLEFKNIYLLNENDVRGRILKDEPRTRPEKIIKIVTFIDKSFIGFKHASD